MDQAIVAQITDLISGGVAFLLIPAINGLIAIVKTFVKDARWYPIFSIAFGIIGAIALAGISVVSIVGGILLGLMSTGLYEVVKTSVAGK